MRRTAHPRSHCDGVPPPEAPAHTIIPPLAGVLRPSRRRGMLGRLGPPPPSEWQVRRGHWNMSTRLVYAHVLSRDDRGIAGSAADGSSASGDRHEWFDPAGTSGTGWWRGPRPYLAPLLKWYHSRLE
jgi:hypothetical protein